MRVAERKLTVSKLVQAFRAGSLVRNPEYQRGAAWTLIQKASFIDSIMRGYPVPAIFLHEVVYPGLDDEPSKKHEIVDGQQRILALRDYLENRYSLLGTGPDSKLRIPRSVLAKEAPWAGKLHQDLSSSDRDRLEAFEFTVFQVDSATDPDEVRDLFIRLQSGTPLSRQQVRDAWPGNLGPFVERLAGKLTQQPQSRLFSLVDKRGQRFDDEDMKDSRVPDRQACAQLLRVCLVRAADPLAYPSVSARELDELYHQHTDFDSESALAGDFVNLLERTATVFEEVSSRRDSKRRKFRRLEITAVMMFLQDMTRTRSFKLDSQLLIELAARIAEADSSESPVGKSTSGSTLRDYYEWFREHVTSGIGLHLDDKRCFDEEQKREIRRLAEGMCAVCGEGVDPNDEEYDHYPVPHRDGGRTIVDNGRLVHRSCHSRGRPRAADR